MNERIKELADQAELTINTSIGTYMSHPEFNQKFAELIVRECICQCDDENSQKYIMSHFGFTEKDWS